MHKSSQDNYLFLTQGPIRKVITTMAFPTIVGMLVTALYNMADTFFVGQLSTQATAAVGVAFSMMFFVQSVSFFYGHGTGNFMARELGARHQEQAEIMAATGLTYALLTGVVIGLMGIIFLTPLSQMLGSTSTILPYTHRYLGIVLLGTPFATGSFTLNNQLRFQGNASLAMRGIVTGALLNVALDPLFIFAFGWGIAGAAIATVVGQVVSFVILLIMVQRSNVRLSIRNIRWQGKWMREIIAGGTPSLSRQGLTALAAVLLNHAAAPYGDAAIAAMSIVSRFTMLLIAGVIGFGQGFQPFCGFCYGAHLYERVRRGFWFSVRVTTLFLLLCSVVGWVWSEEVIRAFRHDPAVMSIGTHALRWQLAAIPTYGLAIMANMLTQTTRKTIRANILAAARTGIFFVPLILILPHCWGLMGVQMCQSVSDYCALFITIPILINTFREMRSEERQ